MQGYKKAKVYIATQGTHVGLTGAILAKDINYCVLMTYFTMSYTFGMLLDKCRAHERGGIRKSAIWL